MTDNHTKAVTVIEKAEIAPRQLHPLAQAMMAALEKSPDPETMRQVLALQREHEAHEAKRMFSIAMVSLKNDLPAIISRDKAVSFSGTKYSHASLAHVLEEVEPHLTRFGFSLSWRISSDEKGVTCVCVLTHQAGHSIDTTMTAPADKSGSKNPIQAIGSTSSYLQRYSALALLGITTGDVPDADDQAAPDVDTKRNLRACAEWSKRTGGTRPSAEALIGKPIDEWTTQDLKQIEARPVSDPAATRERPVSDLGTVLWSFTSATNQAELAGAAAAAKTLGEEDKKTAQEAYRKRRAELKDV